ncbi:SAM-dependent chlorinase/fluorinase [Cryptosporangium minutisporangium]|uniref:SAM-dependent chlorinase/fluorinase n=2 Tax=Cryptosporangium minutisporangium TaxID=113569 RepID=A0ABP6SU83_9ACTN
MLLQLIADYGVGDLAYAEVRQRLARYLPDADVVYTPVPPFDTIGAGFCVAQLALTPGPPGRLIYCNVAPRADTDEPRPDNEGERLVAAVLPDGTQVVAVDAGHVFSFLRDEAVSLSELAIPNSGSQFRSRDAFPSLLPRVLAGEADVVGPVDPGRIPPPPERAVLYVDGYGNLKTSWSEPPAPLGSVVTLRVGGVGAEAVVSDGTFDVPAGSLSFAPGSSGWTRADGSEVRWYELLLRGGNASAVLDHPEPGTPVHVRV